MRFGLESTYASKWIGSLDVQCSTNTDAYSNMNKPDVDRYGAAHGDHQVCDVVEWLELNENIESNIQPRGHRTNIQTHVQSATAHNALWCYREIDVARNIDHRSKSEGDAKACWNRVPGRRSV
jgi:hypothetical protein